MTCGQALGGGCGAGPRSIVSNRRRQPISGSCAKCSIPSGCTSRDDSTPPGLCHGSNGRARRCLDQALLFLAQALLGIISLTVLLIDCCNGASRAAQPYPDRSRGGYPFV